MIGRKTLEARIKKIEDMLLKMHSITTHSVQAIVNLPSNETMNIIIESEYATDVINWELFEEAIATLATQQPTAKDLRFIVMATTIAAIYERINDLTLDVAKYIERLARIPQEFNANLKVAVETILKMLETTKQAMTTHNFINLHDKLTKLDDIIDDNFQKVVNLLKSKESLPKEAALDLILIFRDLERIGDLIGKIGSRFIYIETGKMIPIK